MPSSVVEPRAIAADDLAPRAVLVIAADDIRDRLVDMLATAGHRVIGIGNSLEAVAYLRREPTAPSMIVLDWNTPGMTGLAFIAFHASSALYHQTPIVVIAEPVPTNVPRLYVCAVLHRPVPMGRLIDVVDRHARTGNGVGPH